MILKDVLKEIIIKIDSSEKTNIVLALFQVLAAASIGVYTIYAGSQTDITKLSIYIFWIFQPIVFFYFLGMLLISEKYRAIKLRLNVNTGFLYAEESSLGARTDLSVEIINKFEETLIVVRKI